MKNECGVCGHINGHAPGCPEAPQPDFECCSECGQPFENGDAYYEHDSDKYCEECFLDIFRQIMDYDMYSYEDYLEDEYERRRHDV